MSVEEPWFPGATTTNFVDFDQLEAVFAKATSKTQDFLEFQPYFSRDNIPLQTYSAKDPFKGLCLGMFS